MFKNITVDHIGQFVGWALVNGLTFWMIVTYIRQTRRDNKKYGKGWRKKLWDRLRE